MFCQHFLWAAAMMADLPINVIYDCTDVDTVMLVRFTNWPQSSYIICTASQPDGSTAAKVYWQR